MKNNNIEKHTLNKKKRVNSFHKHKHVFLNFKRSFDSSAPGVRFLVKYIYSVEIYILRNGVCLYDQNLRLINHALKKLY
jgi:hypothetical protein